jgi:hypothetical protein
MVFGIDYKWICFQYGSGFGKRKMGFQSLCFQKPKGFGRFANGVT